MKACVKKIFLVGAVLASMVPSFANQNGTVAIVDVRSVVEGSKHFMALQQDMQKKLGNKHEELVLAQKELTTQLVELEKSKKVMAAATYSKKSKAPEAKLTEHAAKERAFQEEVMKLQEQSMKKLYKLVKDATKKVAEKNKFDIVLQGEALYAKPQFDITSEVKKSVENSKL